MYNDVVAFAPLSKGKLFVELANGDCGIFDMCSYMESDFFSELKNDTYFNRAYIEYGVITWPHGQDISPATIRLEMVRQPCPHGLALKRVKMEATA
jgi:hypothetical protein